MHVVPGRPYPQLKKACAMQRRSDLIAAASGRAAALDTCSITVLHPCKLHLGYKRRSSSDAICLLAHIVALRPRAASSKICLNYDW